MILRRLLPTIAVAGLGLTACSGSSGSPASPPLPTIDVAAATPVSTMDAAVPPAPGAASAREAVQRYLSAEIAGDTAASFDLLADPIRADLGDAQTWEGQHVDLPRYLSFEVTGEEPGAADTATVVTNLALDPGLDPVTGLTPGRAVVRWPLVRNANGWTIQLDDAEVMPVLPPDDGARDAAAAFATGGSACDPAVAAGLLGDPAAATALCQARGVPTLGATAAVGDGAARDELVAAFGPDASTWARQVPLAAPVKLRLLLVPLGQAWEVIGLAAP